MRMILELLIATTATDDTTENTTADAIANVLTILLLESFSPVRGSGVQHAHDLRASRYCY